MKKRKTIQEIIQERLDELDKEDNISNSSNKKENKSTEQRKIKGYKIKDLEKYLFEDTNTIPVFKEVEKEVEDNTLMITTITKSISDLYGIPVGQYIGVAKELIKDNSLFDDMFGKMPRDLYNRCRVIDILAHVDTDNEDYQQKDLVLDVKNGKKFNDFRSKGKDIDFMPISSERIDYLSLLNKKDIENKIEETLKRYNALSDPDERLKYYIKLRDSMNTDSKIIYCDILDKGVLILD